MKILVFGANNELGKHYTRLLKQEARAFVSVRDNESGVLDKLNDLITEVRPTQLVNLSLNPGLFRSEQAIEKERSELLSQSCRILLKASKKLKIPLLQHSTVAVFDGSNPKPYLETDTCKANNPLGKLALSLEKKVAKIPQHIILRTEGIYGPESSCFFQDCIALCKANKGRLELLDQRCSPTPVGDVARVILAINKQVDCDADAWGVFHYCALQATHRHTFVEKFLQEAAHLDKEIADVIDELQIETQQSNKSQLENSVLDCSKIMATYGIKQRSRGTSLKEQIAALY
ncbi:MAG: hypothetical protein CMP91_10950 [Gammaproteobacteria bacterium]|nr:hypothetical protein [Gammaproteobacteria bacterium]MAY02029.1 hypothetical protein [Gammaproteobacteria bacterium]